MAIAGLLFKGSIVCLLLTAVGVLCGISAIAGRIYSSPCPAGMVVREHSVSYTLPDTLPKPRVALQSAVFKDSAKIYINSPSRKADSTVRSLRSVGSAVSNSIDTSVRNIAGNLRKQLKASFPQNPLKSIAGHLPSKPRLSNIDSSWHRQKGMFALNRPFLVLTPGFIDYSFQSRSVTDTPFAERNISQHSITGMAGVTVLKQLPLNVRWWIRRTNSAFYRDITDVQVSLDQSAFRQMLAQKLKQELTRQIPGAADSILQRVVAIKNARLSNVTDLLSTKFTLQQLHEYHELLQIDQAHPENRPQDSVARLKYDDQLEGARYFIKTYDSLYKSYQVLGHELDSLKDKLANYRRKIETYKKLLEGRQVDWSAASAITERLDSAGISLPSKYRWLLGLKNFSLGKTPLQYSELSAKNVAINGINLEYNSWYYIALAAGTVDYRFNDFVGNRSSKPGTQYLLMARIGLGQVERNHAIVSVFKGRKQLFVSNNPAQKFIDLSGIAAEFKWFVEPNTSLTTEFAQSVAPDYRTTPAQTKPTFGIGEHNNQAISIKLQSTQRRIGARIEGLYKYSGANYQSFSSYQSSSALKTWYIKWDQNFFKQVLRLSLSLRSNEFSNPYVLQNYKGNTVFKSATLTLRKKHWPILTAGYIPVSQFSYLGNQLVENRFQTINTSITHLYKIGSRPAMTSIVYSRFFNSTADSSIPYYNASNVFVSQNIRFSRYELSLNISNGKNGKYDLTTAEVLMQIPLFKRTVAGLGIKLANLNRIETQTGGRVSIELPLMRKDRISVQYDRSFLPGVNGHLLTTDLGTIHYYRNLF